MKSTPDVVAGRKELARSAYRYFGGTLAFAALLLHRGRLNPPALWFLGQAAQVARDLDDQMLRGQYLAMLAQMHAECDNPDEAIEYSRKAYQALKSSTLRTEDPATMFHHTLMCMGIVRWIEDPTYKTLEEELVAELHQLIATSKASDTPFISAEDRKVALLLINLRRDQRTV